jgi:hypothetical protein
MIEGGSASGQNGNGRRDLLDGFSGARLVIRDAPAPIDERVDPGIARSVLHSHLECDEAIGNVGQEPCFAFLALGIDPRFNRPLRGLQTGELGVQLGIERFGELSETGSICFIAEEALQLADHRLVPVEADFDLPEGFVKERFVELDAEVLRHRGDVSVTFMREDLRSDLCDRGEVMNTTLQGCMKILSCMKLLSAYISPLCFWEIIAIDKQ